METPIGLQQIIQLFGQPGSPDCSAGRMNLPSHIIEESRDKDAHLSFQCHKIIEPVLEEIFSEVMVNYPDYFYSFGGCYCNRPKRTRGTEKSVHAWGIAVDLNVAYNPLGYHHEDLLERYAGKSYLLEVRGEKIETPCTKFVFTPTHPVVVAFEKRGFFWGGNFHRTKDGMHMQYARNY